MWPFKIKWARLVFWASLALSCGLHVRAELVAPPRAIWMWEASSFTMLAHPDIARNSIAFLKAKGVNTIYLYADEYQGLSKILTQPQQYASLIKHLHQQDFKVYALLGSWHLKTHRYVLPQERGKALQMFQRVLDYNTRVNPSEQFDGINIDIEPHMLDEWDSQKIWLLEQWIELSHEFMRLKRQSNLSLKVGPAIPFWLDNIPIKWNDHLKPTSQHLQDIYDYVALMDYRDRAEGGDGIISHAENEMTYAANIGKEVVIGIETGPNEIKKVSFNHLTEIDMNRELALVYKAFASQRAFAGFVIHHFDTYKHWVMNR
jgi:hypothetical protein